MPHDVPGPLDPQDEAAVLRACFAQTRMAIVITDPSREDNPIVGINPAFTRLTGYGEDEALGRNCRFLQGPGTDREEVARIARAVAERRASHFEILNYRRDGTPFWNALHVAPVHDAEGRLIRFFGSQWDVTEKVEAVRALGAAADEARRLRMAFDEAHEGLLITEAASIDEPGPRIVYASKGFERMTGHAARDVIGRSPRVLQGPGTDRRDLDAVRRHLEAGEPFRSRTVNYRRDGAPFHLEWSITPIRDDDGRLTHWLSVQRDVSEEVEAEERRRLLMGELNHRARNLFSLVLGLARAPVGEGRSARDYQSGLVARIEALVEAHGLVFDGSDGDDAPGEGAFLRDLAAAVLRPLGDAERVRLHGPDARLGPRQALNAALLLHELGTNAVKHGALSAPGGRVDLRWTLEGGEVRLDWTERGGPPARPPERRGFGSQLIEVMVAASTHEDAAIEHHPEGVRCRVGLPAAAGGLPP